MLAQALLTWAQPRADYPAVTAAALCTAWVLVAFVPVFMLGGEYIHTVRRPTTDEQRSDGLSSAEIGFMVRWSPPSYRVGAWLGIALMIFTLLVSGSVTVSTAEPTPPEQLPAMFLYCSAFHLVLLPVLGSASRMPGAYAANAVAAPDAPP